MYLWAYDMAVSVNKNLAASYILEDPLGRIANDGRVSSLGRVGVAGFANVLLSGDYLKVIAFGDSFTDNGDSTRLTNGAYLVSTRGYWVCALSQSRQRFLMLDGQGVSGNTIDQMISRVGNLIATDADIVMLLAGTNDLNQGKTPEQTRDSMATLLDLIISAGKKVLLTPIAKRRTSDGLNQKIEETNNYYKSLVSQRSKDVALAKNSEEFDLKCSVSDPSVTSDGLHPSTYGAWLIGKETAAALDSFFVSRFANKANLAPNQSFSGSAGLLFNGATGAAPDSWRLYYADPTNNGGSGVGGTLNGDGSWTIKTGSNSSIANGTSALARTGNHNIPTQNAEYIFSINVSSDKLSQISLFRVFISCSDVSVGIVEFSIAPPADDLKLNSITLSTPRINVKQSSSVVLYVRIDSDGTEPVEVTIKEPNLFIC